MKREQLVLAMSVLWISGGNLCSPHLAWAQPDSTNQSSTRPYLGEPDNTLILQELKTGQAHKHYYRIPVHNVSPSLVAWWLDPVHAVVPLEIQQARLSLEEVGVFGTLNNPVRPQVQLPVGIQSVIPQEAHGLLLAQGTPEGITALTKLVAALDKPLRKIELEAQFVKMRENDFKSLRYALRGCWFGNLDLKSIYSEEYIGWIPYGIAPQNYGEKLHTLIEQAKATLITLQRFTVVEHLTVGSRFTTYTPATLTFTQYGAMTQVGIKTLEANSSVRPPFYLKQVLGLTATPAVINDATIQLNLYPVERNTLQTSNGQEPLPLTIEKTPQLIGQMQDGETLVLKSVSPTRLKAWLANTLLPDEIIMFLTVRRMANDIVGSGIVH